MATNFTDYLLFNGHTYHVFQQKLTWDSAKTYCESQGGHLVAVINPGVQAFIESFVEDPVWIGGYSPSGLVSDWAWVTGQPWGYTNWAIGQPDNSGGTEPYVQMGVGTSWAGGQWNNWSTTATCYFLCEWDTDITGESKYEGPSAAYGVTDQWYTAPVRPFILRGKLKPDDEEPVECKFIDDRFSPDFELDVRTSTIHLIKGTAVQINRPSAALHIIQVGNGLFLSKSDYILFNLLYHSNIIGQPEPYPDEFLVLREEDLELELPNGYIYDVIFAEAPTLQPQKMSKGRWLYTVQAKFRIIPNEDEQEEL